MRWTFTTPNPFLGLVACAALLGLFAGCAVDPVDKQVAQALESGAAAIRADAELGLRVRADPVFSGIAGVPLISPAMAQFGHDTLDYNDRVIKILRDHQAGLIPDPVVIPPPPVFPRPTPVRSP